MPRYDHTKCDGCGKDFAPGDDIVVCPVCGTPQHRECWNQNHACVNAQKHAEGFVWKDESPQGGDTSGEAEEKDKITACPRCGEKSSAETLFCPRCGQPLGSNANQQNNPYGQNTPFGGFPFGGSPYGNEDPNAQGNPYGAPPFGAAPFFNPYGGVSPEEKIDDVPVPEVAQAVQVNSQFYIPRFKKMEKGHKIGWNWGAFFFGYMWYFYRKNYVTGLIYALIQILFSVIVTDPMTQYQALLAQAMESSVTDSLMASMSALLPTMMLISVFSIIIRVFFTLISNYVYKLKVMRIIRDAKAETQDAEEYQQRIQRKGGANFLFGGLSYMGLFIAANLMMVIVQAIIK